MIKKLKTKLKSYPLIQSNLKLVTSFTKGTTVVVPILSKIDSKNEVSRKTTETKNNSKKISSMKCAGKYSLKN